MQSKEILERSRKQAYDYTIEALELMAKVQGICVAFPEARTAHSGNIFSGGTSVLSAITDVIELLEALRGDLAKLNSDDKNTFVVTGSIDDLWVPEKGEQ